MTDLPANQPREWFPGVLTGPRVAIAISADEVETVRDMIARMYRRTYARERAAAVLRDLDVRVGALGALEPDRPEVVPVQPEDLDLLRKAHEALRDEYTGACTSEINAFFVALDRRLGAAQIRIAAAGEMDHADIPAQRHPDDHTVTAVILDEIDAASQLPDADPEPRTRRPRWSFWPRAPR
jgi:hypothetical protein